MAVAGEGEGVLSQPGGATRASLRSGVAMSFAQSARRLSGGRLATELAMFLLGFADPLDPGIATNGGMGGIHHDHFVVLVGRVLADPVRVEHAEGPDLAAYALLGDRLQRALEFHLVDTMMSRFAVSAAFGNWLLAGTAADAHAVDDETLLGSVAQAPGLFNPGWLSSAMDSRQLPVLPGPHAKKKSHNVGLLFPPQLVYVFVRSHLPSK